MKHWLKRVVSSLVLCVVACTPPAEMQVHKSSEGFTMTFPKDWVVMDGFRDTALTAFMPVSEAVIMVFSMTDPDTDGLLTREEITTLFLKDVPDRELRETGEARIDGVNATWHVKEDAKTATITYVLRGNQRIDSASTR